MIKSVIKAFLIILVLQTTLNSQEININTIVNTAKTTQKHLFIWLHKTDCGYCESMKESTLENEIVKSFINQHFIFVHININEDDRVIYKKFDGSGRDFAKKVNYDFYPSSLFFDDNAEIVHSEVGYRDSKISPNEKRFFTILNFIESKSYKTMDYEDYEFNIKEEL